MNCKKCGSENPDDKKYCGECGAKLEKSDDTVTVATQEDGKQNNRKSKIKFAIIIGCSIALVFSVVLVSGYFVNKNQKIKQVETVYKEAMDLYYKGDFKASIKKIVDINQDYKKIASKKLNDNIDRLYETVKDAQKVKEEMARDNEMTMLIYYHQLAIGMTSEQVEKSWGKPRKINKSTGKYGVHEQWVYNNKYAYIENGYLTSWQD